MSVFRMTQWLLVQVTSCKEEVEKISRLLRRELERFDFNKVKDFQGLCVKYIESVMTMEHQVRAYAPVCRACCIIPCVLSWNYSPWHPRPNPWCHPAGCKSMGVFPSRGQVDSHLVTSPLQLVTSPLRVMTSPPHADHMCYVYTRHTHCTARTPTQAPHPRDLMQCYTLAGFHSKIVNHRPAVMHYRTSNATMLMVFSRSSAAGFSGMSAAAQTREFFCSQTQV